MRLCTVAAWCMKTSTILIVSAAWLAGCAGSTAQHADAPRASMPFTASAPVMPGKAGEIDETYDAAKATPVAFDPRKVGDFVVFAFDGSYRNAPLTLTERVVARTHDTITVDNAFAEKGKPTETLRVTTSLARGHAGDVVHVEQKNEKGAFVEAKAAMFDTLMGMTVAAVDTNDEQVSRVPGKTTVGGTALDVEKTTYRVRIGQTKATMETFSNDQFVWGDVGGEIRSDAGAVVYSAKLIDMGSNASTVASLDKPIAAH